MHTESRGLFLVHTHTDQCVFMSIARLSAPAMMPEPKAVIDDFHALGAHHLRRLGTEKGCAPSRFTGPWKRWKRCQGTRTHSLCEPTNGKLLANPLTKREPQFRGHCRIARSIAYRISLETNWATPLTIASEKW